MKTLLRTLILAAAAVGLLVPAAASAYTTLDGCNPVWTTQPSPYHVNSSGYSRIDLPTVESIFETGFDAWTEPCCSAWRASYSGRTSGVGEDSDNRQNIISFREASWPSRLGDPSATLAVTLTIWQSNFRGECVNLTADMVFNAANHTFGTSASRGVTDLLAVTTHEQGHWLGLGHSRLDSATMYFQYFGEDGRSLHPDDIDGVCDLYPGDCGCSSDADCDIPGEECIGGTCQRPPCATDGDCPEGLACVAGDCIVPPCVTDADCLGAQICDDGDCIIDADCPTCLACTANDDCGPGWLCAGTDGTVPGFCTKLCSAQSDCPGNSACFGIEGEDFNLCLNDDASDVGLCHDGYVCTEEPSACGDCPAGQVCDEDAGACVEQPCIVCETCETSADCPGGECLSDGTRDLCFLECGSDADCPGDSACLEVPLEGGGSVDLCLNADAATAGICPDDYTCGEGGGGPTDPCDGVTCGAGEVCDPATGACVDDGSGGGGTDWPGDCPVCAPCATDADCGAGGECANLGGGNVCILSCDADPNSCPGNTECFEVDAAGGGTRRICLNDDAGASGVCPAGFVCDSTAGGGGGEDAGGGGSDAGGEDAGGSEDTGDVAAGGEEDDTGEGGGVPIYQTGNGCAAAGSGAGAGFGGLLLALVAVRRRRR